MSDDNFLKALRGSAPYIHAHRGRTFVVAFGGEAARHPNFNALIYDIALLHSLGVRLVLVHGARPQIEARIAAAGLTPRFENGMRITDPAALDCVKQAVGALRTDIEALLSTGLASTPMGGARLRVAGGNLVAARPMGVRGGVDYQHTGTVRRVDARALHTHLEQGSIVLLPPVGYSPTGEIFNLTMEEVATATAAALGADKLVLIHTEQLTSPEGRPGGPRQLIPAEARELAVADQSEAVASGLTAAAEACSRGVKRSHLVSMEQDGALLRELYTRDGAGTLVAEDGYDVMRPATIEDVGGILNLIAPLEAEGVLVPRSREQLELELNHFVIMARDGMIVACFALFPYPQERVAELACVAVHPDYQRQGRAETLLHEARRLAHQAGIERLFVLTTHAMHWFQEHGFHTASLSDLPVSRRDLYNFQRNSKVLVLRLSD